MTTGTCSLYRFSISPHALPTVESFGAWGLYEVIMDFSCKKCGVIESDYVGVVLTCECISGRMYDLDEACKSVDALCDSGTIDLRLKDTLIGMGLKND